MSNVPEGFEVPVTEHHARYRQFDINATSLLLLGFASDIYGWSVSNPSGSVAASMDLYDGADSSGTPVLTIKLATSADDIRWFGPNGVRFSNACFANVTAGEVKGSLFYRHVRL